MKRFASPFKRYRGTVEALSPVHIGATDLLPACRYAFDGGKGAVLKERHLYRQHRQGIKIQEIMTRPSELHAVDDEDIFYPLHLAPAATRLNKEAYPFIRDPFGRPYIPGSSLKGMFRQALLFSAVLIDEKLHSTLRSQMGELLEKMGRANRDNIKDIRRQDWRRANSLEKLFRNGRDPDPKNDLLRGLRISDAVPAGDETLALEAIDVFTAKGEAMVPLSPNNPPLFRETLQKGQRFVFDIALDEAFLKTCETDGRTIRLRTATDLLLALHDQARLVADLEKAFLETHSLSSLWDETYAADDGESAVARLGWGCGWTGHSLFPLLAYGPEMEETPRSPRSRRLVVDDRGRPRSMLGWARLKIEEA